MSIAQYLELPRFGQCQSTRERVTGVGPCVEIFPKRITCREEDFYRICYQLNGKGMKLFDDDDNIKFLLNLKPKYYLALSSRAISVFEAFSGKARENLCEDDDEIIGHGKIYDHKYKRVMNDRTSCGEKDKMKFKLLVVFKSGIVHRLHITAIATYKKMEITINKIVENKSALGTLIAAPIINKTDLVFIYEDTIVKQNGIVCRGTPAEGRQVIFAVGGLPWKNKIFLVTDDGEAHYAKMTGQVGDGKMALFGSGKTTFSSNGLKIKEPTACCLWSNREIVVGNENGEMYRLDKKNFELIDEYELEYGPITFLQGPRGVEDLWIGSKEGVMQNYDDIC